MRRFSLLFLLAAFAVAALAALPSSSNAQVVGSLPSGGSSATTGRTETSISAPSGRRVHAPAIRARGAVALRAIPAVVVLTRRGFVL